jgi:hypothetical protein
MVVRLHLTHSNIRTLKRNEQGVCHLLRCPCDGVRHRLAIKKMLQDNGERGLEDLIYYLIGDGLGRYGGAKVRRAKGLQECDFGRRRRWGQHVGGVHHNRCVRACCLCVVPPSYVFFLKKVKSVKCRHTDKATFKHERRQIIGNAQQQHVQLHREELDDF